jgi:hypothetical protein
LLTLVTTYPLATHLTTSIPGDGFDGWQNYWNFWWVKTALLDLHQSPYFTHYLYYPAGVSLLFQTLNIFNSLLTLPLQLTLGLTVSYNFVVLFSFVVGGYGAYLLAMEVLGSRVGLADHLAAFLAGVVFTFAPFHFAHLLGHLQVISLEWLPFYVLCLIRSLSSERLRVVPHIVLPVVFLVFTALCDWYYVLYLLIFTLAYLGYRLWRRRRPGPLLLKTGLVVVTAGLILSPLLAPIVAEALRDSAHVSSPFDTTVRLSADLLAFVTPNEFHPVWGGAAATLSRAFTSSQSERIVFAGYIPLALGAYAVWAARKRALFWMLCGLLFAVLALGPYLHVGGRELAIPLPYLWLYRLFPLLSIARSVSRFDVMVMLSLAVLASIGLRAAVRTLPPARATLVAAASIALVCVEFFPAPYPLSEVEIPGFYDDLALDQRQYAVLELPMNWDRPSHLLYQTVHHKPLVAGYVTRPNPASLVERVPVLEQLRFLGPDIIAQDPQEVADEVFRYMGIEYAILDQYMLPPGKERGLNLALIQEIFSGQPAVYEDDRMTVFRTATEPGDSPFLILGEGWGERHLVDGRPQRALGKEATLAIVAPEGGQTTLTFTAFSADVVRPLELWADDQLLGRYEVTPEPAGFETDWLTFTSGVNWLLLRDVGEGEPAIVFSSLNLE